MSIESLRTPPITNWKALPYDAFLKLSSDQLKGTGDLTILTDQIQNPVVGRLPRRALQVLSLLGGRFL